MQIEIDDLQSLNTELKKKVQNLQKEVDNYNLLLNEKQIEKLKISAKKDSKTYSDD